MGREQQLAVVGKMPCRGEFVRTTAMSEVERAFEAWLQVNVERSRGKIPECVVRFLVRPMVKGPSLVGTWIPSRDAVGREFPLAIVACVPEELSALPWSLLPLYYGTLLECAGACLARAADANFETLVTGAHALELPHPSSALRALHEASQAITALQVVMFGKRLFGEGWREGLNYALATLLQATEQHDLTMDLPCSSESDLYVWLELSRACLGRRASPGALLWTADGQRALVTLGSPSEQSVTYLMEPDHASQRRWPLWTKRAEAARGARRSIPAAILDAIEQDASMQTIVQMLERERLS